MVLSKMLLKITLNNKILSLLLLGVSLACVQSVDAAERDKSNNENQSYENKINNKSHFKRKSLWLDDYEKNLGGETLNEKENLDIDGEPLKKEENKSVERYIKRQKKNNATISNKLFLRIKKTKYTEFVDQGKSSDTEFPDQIDSEDSDSSGYGFSSEEFSCNPMHTKESIKKRAETNKKNSDSRKKAFLKTPYPTQEQLNQIVPHPLTTFTRTTGPCDNSYEATYKIDNRSLYIPQLIEYLYRTYKSNGAGELTIAEYIAQHRIQKVYATMIYPKQFKQRKYNTSTKFVAYIVKDINIRIKKENKKK